MKKTRKIKDRTVDEPTLSILNHTRGLSLHHTHSRVGGAQIDANDCTLHLSFGRIIAGIGRDRCSGGQVIDPGETRARQCSWKLTGMSVVVMLEDSINEHLCELTARASFGANIVVGTEALGG